MGARTAADGKWVRRIARMAADGVGATEWLEMGGEKGKEGKGWERKGQEGKGRDRKGKEGKGWERKEKGRERNGKDGERKGKEGKGRERMGKEGKGKERIGKERKRMGKEGKGMERTAADGVGAREWLEMGGEKKPLVMSELGCADGCGRGMGAEKCADGCGRRGCNGVAGNGWGEEAAGDQRAWLRGRLRTACEGVAGNGWRRKAAGDERAWLRGRQMDGKNCADGCGRCTEGREKKPLGMGELGCADGCGRQMGVENCADGCGRRGCQGVAGNGWGEEAAGDERPWLRGRLRTANGCGELRGRLRTAWVQGGGWKCVGRRSRW